MADHPEETDESPRTTEPQPVVRRPHVPPIVTVKEEDTNTIDDIQSLDSKDLNRTPRGNSLLYDVYLGLADFATRHVAKPTQRRFRLLFIISITPAVLTFASFAACLVAGATIAAGIFTLFWFGVAFVAFWIGGALYAFVFAVGLTLLAATVLLVATLVGALFIATAVAGGAWHRIVAGEGSTGSDVTKKIETEDPDDTDEDADTDGGQVDDGLERRDLAEEEQRGDDKVPIA